MNQDATPSSMRTTLLYAGALITVGVLILFRSPLMGSLWLDETITRWIVDGSIRDAYVRAYEFQGQSPLYYVFIWLFQKCFGDSEIALRLPSLFAGFIAVYYCFHLSLHFTGRKIAGLGAALLLLLSDGFLQAVFSARPYAAALAASLASIYFFLMYREKKHDRFLWWSCFFLVLAYYLHYLFVLSLVVHFTFLMSEEGGEKKRTLRAFFYVALACVPGLFQLRKLSERASDLSFAPQVGPLDFLQELLPIATLVYIVFPVVVVWIVLAVVPRRAELPSRKLLACLVLWHVFPIALFALHSLCSDSSLFVGRYFLWGMIGLCVLGGILLTAYQSLKALNLVLAILFLFALGRESERTWQVEDWRGAFRAVAAANTSSSPALVYSGLIESDIDSESNRKENLDYLLSPLRAYGEGLGGIPLPSNLDRHGSASFAVSMLLAGNRIQRASYVANVKTVLANDGKEWKVHEAHLKWFQTRGFENEKIFESPGVVAYKLTRSSP